MKNKKLLLLALFSILLCGVNECERDVTFFDATTTATPSATVTVTSTVTVTATVTATATTEADRSADLFDFRNSEESEADSPSIDRDKDGLNDEEEKSYGTNPLHPDTDSDGLLDGYEVRQASDPLRFTNTNGLRAFSHLGAVTLNDSDGDGLPNSYEEQISKTDPGSSDSDNDGKDDGAELLEGSDPLQPSTHEIDSDGDGLSNALEARLGSNPALADTDSDGLPDSYEFLLGFIATDPDTNGDGIKDGAQPGRWNYRYTSRLFGF